MGQLQILKTCENINWKSKKYVSVLLKHYI